MLMLIASYGQAFSHPILWHFIILQDLISFRNNIILGALRASDRRGWPHDPQPVLLHRANPVSGRYPAHGRRRRCVSTCLSISIPQHTLFLFLSFSSLLFLPIFIICFDRTLSLYFTQQRQPGLGPVSFSWSTEVFCKYLPTPIYSLVIFFALFLALSTHFHYLLRQNPQRQ